MPSQSRINPASAAMSRHHTVARTVDPFIGPNDHPASSNLSMNTPSKVTTEHLQRIAYLYIRQSSLHQVFENSNYSGRF